MKFFENDKFKICYKTWGNSRHTPLLFFHGFPGSHIQASVLEPLLNKHKIYLIAADRPGYGGTIRLDARRLFTAGQPVGRLLSAGQPVGRLSRKEYLHALRELLTKLKADRFHIVGVSGGSPWAHLMASEFSEDVRSLQIICGLGPLSFETAPYFSKFQTGSLVFRRFTPSPISETLVNLLLRNFNAKKKLDGLIKILNPSDQAVLREDQHFDMIMNSMAAARKQGAKGIVNDTALYNRDWLREDCDLKRLSKIPTFYFHGKQDRILDYRMSNWLHKVNPKSKLKLFADEGHYSLPLRQADAILHCLGTI